MHEASLAGGILQLVEDVSRRERFSRVSVLRLSVGQLANVELEALRFSLSAIAPGTVLEGAAFEIRASLVSGLQPKRAATRARRCMPALRQLPAPANGGAGAQGDRHAGARPVSGIVPADVSGSLYGTGQAWPR